MKKIRQMMVIVFILAVAFCSLPVRADPHWNESMLRTGLENAINCRWRKIAEQSTAIGFFLDKRLAYAGLCEIRIDLLKKISEREIFLPADVAEYVRCGHVPPESDEAMALEKVASLLHDRNIWKPIIDKLIYAYESIKAGYGPLE